MLRPRLQLPDRPGGPAHVPTPRHRSPRRRAKPLDGHQRDDVAEGLVTKKKARSEMGALSSLEEETPVACAYFCRFANHFSCR